MAIPPRLPNDPVVSYGGCTCNCHKYPKGTVMHVVACCYPGKRSLFERVQQINSDRNNEAEMRRGDEDGTRQAQLA